MAKFLENTASVKREAGRTKKKKKQETTQKKVQSPSVSQRAQETNQRLSQKYGGGSTRTSSSSQRNNQTQQNLPNRRYQNTMESRNPRMLDSPTNQRRYVAPETTNGGSQGRRNQQYLEEDRKRRQRESEERRQAAQRQKMGMNSLPSKEGQEAANRAVRNTPSVVKESARQVAIGHGKTLADVTELNESSAIGSKIDIKSKEFQEDIERRRKKSTEKSHEAFNALSKSQERSEKRMQDLTKDAKGLEKAYYGALESGTGMLTDQALGPAWAVSMLSRTYGNTRGKAKQEGATDAEDRAYSLAQAAKEVATEYLFKGTGIAKNLSGAKSLAPSEKLAKLATRNMRGPLADATHAGIRLLGGTMEENAEEAIGWGADPLIKEFTYGRNVRTRQAQQMLKDQSDQLRANIGSEEEAEAVAAYLNSPDFIESNVRTYMDNGIGETEARELAEDMRDYLAASLSGDTESMADIEDNLSKKLSGKSLKQVMADELSFSELKDTIASTTLLTGVTGLPGAVSTTMRGDAIRQQLGTEGIRALADTAIDFEDNDMSAKAQAMRDRMDSGKDITSTQAYDLAQGVQEQFEKDARRQDASYQTAQRTISSENLITPYQIGRNGSVALDEVTAKSYESNEKSARETISAVLENDEQASLTEAQIDKGSRAIAGFKTGVFTVDDANELNFRNTAVRDAFKAETGIDLSQYIVKGKDGEVDIPKTNAATKQALFAMAADNLVKSAEAETANWMDNTKGEVVTQITKRMGSQGSIALQTALDDVDERDRARYMTTANASDMLYHAGREMGADWEDVKSYATSMYKNIPEEKLKAMYDAGIADRDMATDKARGAQIAIGKAISEQNTSEPAPMGELIIDPGVEVKGSVIRTFSEIASNLGVDIRLVDQFVDKDGKVLKNQNGMYDPKTGTISINVRSDFEKNIGYIFMHECTHHLKMFAPEQYNELENLVRDKWFNYDSAQMQSEIAKKIELYAAHGQTLTEEQALAEIIADATHEFINDSNFAKIAAEENPSLAKAMLDTIRNAMRAIRRILSLSNLDDETHMNTLFSQLGILDEAERLWLNAYTQAVANRAAVGIEDLQNRIYEEGRLTEQSATSEKLAARMSISEDLDEPYMAAVESGNMEEAQKYVDEAAKRAMPNTKLHGLWYHGTDNDFNIFDFRQGGTHGTAEGFGIYLSDSQEVTSHYGNRQIKGYVNMQRPASAFEQTLTHAELKKLVAATVEHEAQKMVDEYDGDIEAAKKDSWISNYVNTSQISLSKAISETAKAVTQWNGNDMDIVQEIMNGMGIRSYEEAVVFNDILTETTGIDGYMTKWGDEDDMSNPNNPTIAVAFRSNQIKSADTVTYAEDGSVIPLSERFDPNNNDIRYSLSTTDSDGNILTDGQMEYFKNSQARDEQGRLVRVFHSTDKGGFTVFDPMESNDQRSLFFTSLRRMSESYIRTGQKGDINPYEENAVIRSIKNVDELPEFISDEVTKRARDNISNIRVVDNDGGEVIAEGDDFVEVAKSIVQHLEQKGIDAEEDLMILPDILYDDSNPAQMGEAWEVYNELRSIDGFYSYTMDYADHGDAGTYTCYLNLENPLVIDARGHYWNDIPFDERRGYYKTRELAELAQNEGFDGVIIHNVVDYGSSGYGNDPADVYIAFSSNQVKDTRNENPSENPDIRYSFTPDEDAELMNRLAEANADNWSNEELLYYEKLAEADQAEQNKFFDKIRKWSEDRINVFYDSLVSAEEMPSEDPELEEGRIRMAKSKSDFYNSLSAKWNEKWLTNGEVLDVNSVRGKIKSLIKAQMQNSDTDKQYKTDVLNRTLVDVRTAYLMSKRGRIEVADEILWRSALNMIENVEFIHDETFRDYKGLRDYLRTTKIAVGEELYADIEINEFRRRNFNKIHVVSGATNVDTIYQELCELYPEWFSEEDDMNPADQLLRMEHVLDAIQPYKQAYTSEEAAELAFDIASDLADIIYGYGKPIESVADHYKNKYDQKTKALKVRHQEAMRESQAEISELKKELAKSERTVEREQQRTERAEKKLAEEKQKRKDEKAKKRDAKERARYTGQIDKNYRWLTDRLLNPTQDKNIPEGFRKDLARLLCMFDFQTEKSRELEQKYGIPSQKTFKMWDLHSKLCGVMNEDNGGVFQTNEYLDFLSENIAKRIDGKSLDSLETADLLSVDELLKVIVKQFRNYDSVRVGEKREKVADLGGSVISESDDKVARDGQAKERDGLIGALDKIVNMAELTPIYFFQRLGTMYKMYKEVRKGFDNYVRNEKKMLDQISAICSEYYTKKSNRPGSELQAWRDSRSAQTIQLTHGTVTMTAAQMMSFYCLSKRMQARGHIIQDGIVVTPIQEFSKVAKAMADAKGRTTQVDSVPVTLNDIDTIISKLTPDQIKIADKLQAMMSNEIAEMGNEASMSMYGIRMFKEKDYFPIKVSSRVTAKNMEQVDVTETIKNFGFTKPVKQNASNVIEVDDIFKIVADHCNNMNLYASYGETIGDFWKVFNYKQYNEDGSPSRTVQQALAKAYGDNCLKYIKNFIKDINGNVAGKRSGGLEEALNGILGRAKRAAVFANVRVALQQPTAIVRAFAVLNPKYIASIRVGKETMQEMLEHCPIAQWKSWGFYDTFMGRDIEDVMMNNWSMSDVAMSGAYGYLDNKTWTAIWSMCKAEIKDTRKDLTEGTQEFWDAVNERASYVFDATQVVDSPFHRSDAMRSKDIMVKSLTSFQSEPTLTFNVVRGGIVNALESVRNGNKAEASAILGRTLTVFVAQAVVVSATAAIWDAVRRKGADDDEDATWAELWLDNFFNNLKDNVNLLNNIYLAKELMPYIDKALFGGYGGNNNLLFQGLETLSTGVQQTMKKIEKGDEYDKSWYDVLTNLFGGIGYLGGVPIKTLMRDFKGITSWFGLDVFAADEMESDADKIAKSGEMISESHWYDYNRNPLNIKDGSLVDNVLNHFGINRTEREKEAALQAEQRKRIEKKTGEISKKVSGLSGEEKGKKAWSAVTSFAKTEYGDQGINDLIAAGDFKTINQYREMYESAVGDTEYFDKRIFDLSKKQMKKTIIYNPTYEQAEAQNNLKNYLLDHGMTESELSDMAYKSYTRKELQVAMRLNDQDAVVEELIPLIMAGMTYEDFEKAYKNRNRVNIKEYKESGGKYADRFKSTGVYNWPINGQITSGFGHRSSPGGIGSTNHQGLDIAGSMGDPVGASDGGTVVYAGWYGGAGKTVMIQHDDGTVTQYSHLSWWDVHKGDIVGQGQTIGNVGSTGNSTGPHLHFAVMVNDSYVDPTQYLNKR